MLARWQAEFEAQGWSNWAVERRDTDEFVGFVGLTVPTRVLPFTPCVEVGWRLARRHWHRGHATEAARACLALGFEVLGLKEIVSFTALLNQPSRAVMERLGMRDHGEDFDHPALAADSPLRRHCLYRLSRDAWAEQAPLTPPDAPTDTPPAPRRSTA